MCRVTTLSHRVVLRWAPLTDSERQGTFTLMAGEITLIVLLGRRKSLRVPRAESGALKRTSRYQPTYEKHL